MNSVQTERVIKADYSVTDAIKTLRTNIRLLGNNIQVIMVTSTMEDEGKSEISFAMAEAFARIGKKVLLLDADIRKSVFVSRLNLKQEILGLSQYLSGQQDLKNIIYESDIENFHMIFSGPASFNSSELLEEDLFGILMKYGKEHYDYIVIDTPPLGSVIDGAIIAHWCDGALLVVSSGQVSRRMVRRVKEQIERTGCRILGTVLNKVDKNSRYYSRY